MADTKLSALTADASPTSDDLVYTVHDPGGTPASRKVTIANLNAALDHGALDGLADDDHAQYLLVDGSRAMTGAIELSEPLTVDQGGTGVATFTAHGVLVGAGASDIVATAAGSAGQVLTSGGAGVDPTWQDAAAGDGDVVGPASSTDEALARFDSTTGKLLMDGVVTSTDAGVVAGITQLNVDNVRVDGNTISTTDANGDLVVSPNGTGILRVRAAGYGLGQGGSSLIGRAGGENVWSATASVFSLSANHNLVWNSTSNDSDGSAGDTGLSRNAAGVLRVTNGSTGLGSTLTGRLVEASTAGSGAPNVLIANESRTLLTNEGATAANHHTLPSAAAGLEFIFAVQDSDGIVVTAAAGDTIRNAADVSSSGGTATNSTIGSVIHLVALNATEWYTVSVIGTWVLA